MLRRMHASASVADKWSFEMNSQRAGPVWVRRAIADLPAQVSEGSKRLLERGCHGGRQIAGHAASQHVPFNGGERTIVILHNIMAAAAVAVDVNESPGEDDGRKIVWPGPLPRGAGRARRRRDDAFVVDHNQGRIDGVSRGVETRGCDGSLHSNGIRVRSKV